ADFGEALRLGEDGPDGWAGRGRVYADLGRWDEAIRDLTEAVKREGDQPWLRAERGRAYRGLRRWEEALADLTVAVGERPDSAGTRILLGNTLAELGRWDAAEQEFVRARELKADGTDAWLALAALRLQAGDAAGYRRMCAVLLDQ